MFIRLPSSASEGARLHYWSKNPYLKTLRSSVNPSDVTEAFYCAQQPRTKICAPYPIPAGRKTLKRRPSGLKWLKNKDGIREKKTALVPVPNRIESVDIKDGEGKAAQTVMFNADELHLSSWQTQKILAAIPGRAEGRD